MHRLIKVTDRILDVVFARWICIKENDNNPEAVAQRS